MIVVTRDPKTSPGCLSAVPHCTSDYCCGAPPMIGVCFATAGTKKDNLARLRNHTLPQHSFSGWRCCRLKSRSSLVWQPFNSAAAVHLKSQAVHEHQTYTATRGHRHHDGDDYPRAWHPRHWAAALAHGFRTRRAHVDSPSGDYREGSGDLSARIANSTPLRASGVVNLPSAHSLFDQHRSAPPDELLPLRRVGNVPNSDDDVLVVLWSAIRTQDRPDFFNGLLCADAGVHAISVAVDALRENSLPRPTLHQEKRTRAAPEPQPRDHIRGPSPPQT
jgi:hypothetical protein